MTQFVQNIVQEVLQRNTNKKFDLESKKDNRPKHEPSKTINRPNYQKQRMERRLSPIQNQTPLPIKKSTTEQKVDLSSSSVVHQHRQFKEETLAQFSRLGLVRGEGKKEKEMPPTLTPAGQFNTAQLIGQTKLSSLWFFPQLDAQLISLLQAGQRGKAVGVLTSDKYFPSFLFLVDQLKKDHPKLECHVHCSTEDDLPCTVEFYLDDAEKLRLILKNVYQELQQRSIKQTQIYEKVSPSAWLSQKLQLPTSFGAISLIEGIDYYKGLSILDQCLKGTPTANWQFQLKGNYLMLMGDSRTISQLAPQLKKILAD